MSHWAVESRSVRQFGSKTPQGKTGVEVSKELFDSSKEIASTTRSLPVDVQSALYSESDAVPSAFSEVSESDLTTPTVHVKMTNEGTEICFSNAKNGNTAQKSSSSKVRNSFEGIFRNDFMKIKLFPHFKELYWNSVAIYNKVFHLSIVENFKHL